jgi:hypothetical protein
VPSQTSIVSIYEGLDKKDSKWMRENVQVENLSQKLAIIYDVLQIIYSRLWQGPGISELQVSVKLSAAK